MLTALRHIAKSQDMANVAEKAGMPRESLDRAPGPLGNTTPSKLCSPF